MRTSELELAVKECSGLACATMVQDMVKDISGGNLVRNLRLPSEQELAKKYEISVTAVRRGMEVMVNAGLLARRRGSGTYVNGAPKKSTMRQADTILICRAVYHMPTHPYFGHIYPALYARLAELGWKVREYSAPPQDGDPSQVDYRSIEPRQIAEILDKDPMVAGLVLHRTSDELGLIARDKNRPCVVIGQNYRLPWVDYDWDTEFIRAISLALKAGARRVWAIDSFPGCDEAHFIGAAKAMVRGADQAVIKFHHNQQSIVYSQVVYDSCQAARAMLRAEGPPCDGIVIHSDFHAQGVLDALAEAGVTPDRCPIIVARVNRESRIHSNLPYIALVADGAVVGKAAADLLHRRITQPDQAPKSLCLSCTVEEPSREMK